MKRVLLSGLSLLALSGVAFADPVKLTEQQMDKVVAGQVSFLNTSLVLNIPTAVAPTICVLANCRNAGATVDQSLRDVNFIQGSNLRRVRINN
jgi:hypothetical protein